jgi:tetratricopeptide (TPR) repeat protein
MGTGTHRGLPLRPLVVILLGVCLAATDSSRTSAQQSEQQQPFPRSAWAAIAHGRLSEAESLAKARPAQDPEAAAVLGHLTARTGKYEDAINILEPAASKAPLSTAALELALLHQKLGRNTAAAPLFEALMGQAATATDPDLLARAARAAQALGRPQDANAIYRAANANANGYPGIESAWGNLFLEKFQEVEAVRSFQTVLKMDPRWAPAHAGLAWALADVDPPAAAAAAMKALEIDSTLDSAHLLLAQLDLDNSRPESARERIDKVLAVNPQHLDARALLAAMAYVKGDRAGYDAEVKRILAIHPRFGEVYRAAADLAARNYRFDEAVALAREAIAMDPESARAHAELGMHLLRTGDEPEARRSLERSFNADAFNRVTYNLLMMLDKLDKFTVVEDGNVVVKMHPDEAPVLKEYAVPLAQEALKVLSAKYQFTPKGPIMVEIFPVHDDFAVRNLGLPGMIGALGACFGRVVTMDSPTVALKSGPERQFAWQATLWHEIAHVITLQMSQQRVPRWLTEGISVYEEAVARPEWGRDMEVPFAIALEKGKTLKLTDLNAGFTSPETIALAYFQASVLVEHIVKTYGEEKLRTLLRSYGDGLEGDAALTKTLGTSMAELQSSFDKHVDGRFGALRAALRPVPGLDLEGSTTDLKVATAVHPKSYGLLLAYGKALASSKDKAAFEPLERAAALVPVATGDDSPHALMAELAEQLGDEKRAVQEYVKLLANDHTAVEPARRLGAIADKLGDEAAAHVAYQRIVEIDPSDAAAHTGLGRLASKKAQHDVAIREFTAALALGPTDRAAAHCDLGESLLAKGRKADAKREALAALEIAPSFERAQELLLKSIQSGQERP